MEKLVDAKGYEGIYQVSNLGRVKRLKGTDCMGRPRKERMLKAKQNNR